MANLKYTPWPSAPRLYWDVKKGGKKVCTIRRVSPLGAKKQRFQVVARFVDIMGGAVGPVFPSLAAAKRFVEERAGA